MVSPHGPLKTAFASQEVTRSMFLGSKHSEITLSKNTSCASPSASCSSHSANRFRSLAMP